MNHINPKHLQAILWASWCLALNKRCYLRPTFESFCQESIFKLVTFLLTSAISAISRSNVSQFGLKAQMHFQIVDVSFYWQGYPKGFFPVKLDLLFSPSPFLQCDWWSSQWGRGESRGSQKGWGMMFDAPCIYQISKFAIINLNLLCFFGTNGSFWNLNLQKEIPSQRETQPPRAEKKLPSWYSSRCYSLLCTVW